MSDSEQVSSARTPAATTGAATSTTTAMSGSPVPPPKGNADSVIISKLTLQVKKLTESNGKYKNLLKLAKDRIQQQEEELESLKVALESASSQLSNTKNENGTVRRNDSSDDALGEKDDTSSPYIVRVCQRVKLPVLSSNNTNNNSGEEIWALMELEQQQQQPLVGQSQPYNDPISDVPVKRFREWKRFDTEAQLQDVIRRDTGEPLSLPPFSLTPEQSAKVQKQAKQEIAALTEEFRRFRVKAELARKQADNYIRDLQNAQKQTATLRIEGTRTTLNEGGTEGPTATSTTSNTNNGILNAGSVGRSSYDNQIETLRAELLSTEAYWKEAYDNLLAENNALKSSGSEALLASQWRQRYEQSRQETLELSKRLEEIKQADHSQIFESKYRDLKESFRMYRKKAKEIFETTDPFPEGSADAKLAYLRNLMVNYFTADPTVKPHMEGAIGTLLQFTQEDVERIEKKRSEFESWLF